MNPTSPSSPDPNSRPTVVTPQRPPAVVPQAPPVVQASGGASCAQCGAPMDRGQRYCVSCGAARSDAGNPAMGYLAQASRQTRTSAPVQRRPQSEGSGARAAAVVFLLLLPIAVGVGVLVGRSGGDSGADDAAVLEALAASGGTDAGTNELASDTGSVTVPSDFSLESGWTVELDTLPVDGTDIDAAEAAKDEASKQGAPDVGIFNPAEFTTSPDQGSSNLVLYSGEFEDKGDAEKALKDLEGDFDGAKVIEVTSVDAKGGGSAPASEPQGPVLQKTKYGDVHKVAGAETTPEQEAEGEQIAQDQANSTGKDYIDTQKNLPDVIAVGGDGTSEAPTGAGD